MRTNLRLTLIALSVSLALAACGGGGGGGSTAPASDTSGNSTGNNNGGTNNGGTPGNDNGSGTGGTQTGSLPAPVGASVAMTMSCVGGTAIQCSGGEIIRTDNNIALTRSGVQVYGKSTNDLSDTTKPKGFALASGGTAEVRVAKDVSGASGSVSNPQLLLNNFGISWNHKDERPPIAETFPTAQGRIELSKDAQNRYVLNPVTLPSGTAFFDSATQLNYANNHYFPRAAAITCPTSGCPAIDVNGVQPTSAGNWKSGGTDPDMTSAGRLHEDGDMKAPNVPYPGSKGFRSLFNMSYHYANVAKWVSQDTVDIAEWTQLSGVQSSPEHNQNRRGIVAFGDVTDPTKIPTSGTATYKGWIRGWYATSPDIAGDPDSFRAEATITVNFASRQVTITVLPDSAKKDDATSTKLPEVEFSTTVGMGAAGSNVANYLNGTLAISSSKLAGGIGGRFFGPVGTDGTPPEIGGSFSLTSTTGVSVIGGLIAIRH